MNKKLYELIDVSSIGSEEILSMYSENINPTLMGIFKILGLRDLDVDYAEGMYLHLKSGRKILDTTSGLGVLALGHNHPVVIEAEKYCHKNKVVDMQKLGPNRLQAVLASNLAKLLPGDLNVVTLSVSGAEANEAAIKLVTKAQSDDKKYLIRFEGAYHGKTHGALSLTDSEGFGDGFLVGVPRENIITTPFGDIDAIRNIISKHTNPNGDNDIIAIFLETMGGQDLQVLPSGFLSSIIDICKKNQIITVFDEIKVGMGRAGAGNLFCFQKENVVPDVLTISKALGGGKRAIGAMVTTNNIFKRAYGSRDNCALHSSTFSGIGESCAVAIETLNFISDQNFLDEVHVDSEYFKSQLTSLRDKYPNYIRSIKGSGYFLGIEFGFGWLSKIANFSDNKKISKITNGIGIASIVSILYKDYNVLTHFSGSSPNILFLMPPLIINRDEIDIIISSLESMMKKNFSLSLLNFATSTLKELAK